MTLYFEISPLQEADFTGVSVVTERLADRLMRRLGDDLVFFLRNRVVPREFVEEIVETKRGDHLRRIMANVTTDTAPRGAHGFSYGLYPNMKTQIGVFTVEAQIIHDLSTVLTPQFHAPRTVEEHARAFRREIWSNDVTFCVSEATAGDCAAYFDARAHTELKVIVEGCDWRPEYEALAAARPYAGERKLILILGTLEPRKNVEAVFRLIAAQPGLLKQCDFVFVGRSGWGEEVRETLGRFGLDRQAGESIHFPGFVTDFAKYALLRSAHLVVYPSIFEGFGLPVLEALSLGKHVLTSMSSSITEVGGEACVYFDPNVPEEFEARFLDALYLADFDPVNQAGLEQARRFSWDAAADVILMDYRARAAAAAA